MTKHLHIHRSNRVEELVAALAAMPPALGDPFATERIAVQSRGIEAWLTMRLAEHRGIAANLEFTSPDRLVAAAVAGALGDRADATDAWAPGRLRWRVLAALPEHLDHPALGTLRRYLEQRDGAPPERRRVTLATRVAEVFHRYTIYRPDVVAAWERGEDDGTWQPLLWRALAAGVPTRHLGHRLAAFVAAVDADGEGALTGVTGRVVVFGVNTLPPRYVEALGAIARHREVHLFLPCASAAGREQDRLVAAGENPRFRNPLLASFDRLGSDLQRLLDGLGGRPRYHDRFVAPGAETALAALQEDVLLLRDRGAPSAHPEKDKRPEPLVMDGEDRSVQVHVCHGAMRQVEVLRDTLLGLFAGDASLEPRDVVVLTPDIDTFAPLIHAVFADGDSPEGERGFPALHQVHDLSLQRANPWAEAFLELLDLATGRLKASTVFAFLALPPVLDTIGIGADELAKARTWLAQAGARWGRDAADRARHGQPEDPLHTWRFAFERLLLGHALANDGFQRFAGVSPYDDIEGKDALIAGQVIDYLERLFDTLDTLREPRTLSAWRDRCAALVADLLVHDDDSAGRAKAILDVLNDLVAGAADAGYDDPVEVEALRALLDAPFNARRTAVTFLSGGMTFCTMVPMRSLPFRVVCLLGMDDSSFPRGGAGLGFDRTRIDEARVGDRDDRADDRQAFLETLLSARDHLVVTYSGRSLGDNQQTPPCVPLAELLAVLERGFRGAWRTEHPLSPFSPANFGVGADGASREALSFDRRFLAGARRLRGPRVSPAPFCDGTPVPAPAAGVVQLTALVAFFKDPTAAFLKQRLDVSLDERDDEIADQAPLAMDGLGRWALGRDLVRWRLRGASDEEARAAVLADGRLPSGALARARLDEVDPKARRIARRVAGLRMGARRVVPIAVELDGVELRGRVDDVFDRGRVAFHPTSARVKHLLDVWIHHLALGAVDALPDQSHLVASNGVFSFARISPERARDLLGRLVALYRRGMMAPLPFAPETSDAWLWARRGNKGPEACRFEAKKAWVTYFSKRGEDASPSAARVWGEELLFEHPDFPEVSAAVLEPLHAAKSKVPL
ncbi:MAG: exodeoxyribonuclease V subunit gamma [Deltaproteobacteria bacterium HGW-Deltaproteobacteria-14]|nr:MAG: exodeoxyribonuclease V subunit gamma [Deltaproteobacteria bacterium HGW-Deltaproteobacteria-14]